VAVGDGVDFLAVIMVIVISVDWDMSGSFQSLKACYECNYEKLLIAVEVRQFSSAVLSCFWPDIGTELLAK
jgi:hypothetical protein